MPRETIFTPHPIDPASGPPSFQMEVGWQRDQNVQVGISTPDDRHLVDYIYAGEQAAIGLTLRERLGLNELVGPGGEHLDYTDGELGRIILDAVTGSTPFGTSVWWHPGRVQINELIRKLRRARDAAYGRDE